MTFFPLRHAMECGAATVTIVVVSRYAFTNVQTSPMCGEYAADAAIVSERVAIAVVSECVSIAVVVASPHDTRTHVSAKEYDRNP
jgi:hypothetical protein